MSMVINTNVASLASQRHLASSRADMEQAMERLSSGKRINSAMDDAAGLSISHSLDSKVTSLNQAVRNANDGVAMVNLAEGAMEEISSMLSRMKELATQAANGTYNSGDLENLDAEYQALASEITRISEGTDFNGVNVLNSTDSKNIQVGDEAGDTISVAFSKTSSSSIGSVKIGIDADTEETIATVATTAASAANEQLNTFTITAAQKTNDAFKVTIDNTEYSGITLAALETAIESAGFTVAQAANATTATSTDFTIEAAAVDTAFTISSMTVGTRTQDAYASLSQTDITSSDDASNAMAAIDQAMTDVDAYRSDLGAIANRLEHTSANLMSRVEHQSAARSRIEDADYAVESANLAKAQVLQQAGTAMLSQANASTQNVLSLLK